MRPARRLRLLPVASVLALAACAGGEGAAPQVATVSLAATSPAADASVPVVSLRARRFLTTVRQRYDYSCGSAAVATLLTHHYGLPTAEEEVLRDMLAHGDRGVIQTAGFSLLDMQAYLARRGLRANGYRVPLARLEAIRLPAIALIDNGGYRHFVVVRGIDPGRVLLADPNLGTRSMPRERFEEIWNGVLFVVLDNPATGQASFGRASDWAARPRVDAGEAIALLDAGRPFLGFPDARVF